MGVIFAIVPESHPVGIQVGVLDQAVIGIPAVNKRPVSRRHVCAGRRTL